MVTPSGLIKCELSDKTLIFAMLSCSNVNTTYSVSLYCINIIHYYRSTVYVCPL